MLLLGLEATEERKKQTSKASLHLWTASLAEDPGFESRLRLDFSGKSHTGDLKIGYQPGARRYRVSVETDRPGVRIL